MLWKSLQIKALFHLIFAYLHLYLLIFSYLYLSPLIFTYLYLSLLIFTHLYLSSLILTYLSNFIFTYLSDLTTLSLDFNRISHRGRQRSNALHRPQTRLSHSRQRRRGNVRRRVRESSAIGQGGERVISTCRACPGSHTNTIRPLCAGQGTLRYIMYLRARTAPLLTPHLTFTPSPLSPTPYLIFPYFFPPLSSLLLLLPCPYPSLNPHPSRHLTSPSRPWHHLLFSSSTTLYLLHLSSSSSIILILSISSLFLSPVHMSPHLSSPLPPYTFNYLLPLQPYFNLSIPSSSFPFSLL